MDPVIDVQLSSEISGALRSLKVTERVDGLVYIAVTLPLSAVLTPVSY